MVRMKSKLSDSELGTLVNLLDRATKHEQVSFGLEFDDPKCDYAQRFTIFPRICGSDGVKVDLGCSFANLAWLWRRVCGARGGAKRKLTSKQARAMAAKRHKQNNMLTVSGERQKGQTA